MPRRVGGCQAKDAIVVGLDAVKLRKKLVDHLPAAAAFHIRPARPQGIHLVKEQHAGLAAPSPVKQRMQVLLAVSNPHVEHVVDADGEKVRVDLARGRASEMRTEA